MSSITSDGGGGMEPLRAAFRHYRVNARLKHLPPIEPPFVCERCGTSGISGYNLDTGDEYCTCQNGQRAQERVRRIQQQDQEETACWYRERNARRLEEFSLRHRIQAGRFPLLLELEPTAAVTKLRRFADSWQDQDLIITGKNGVGKTLLTLSLLHTLAETLAARGRSIRIQTAPELFDTLRKGMDREKRTANEGYAEVLAGYRTCGLLVIDDLGAEMVTDWTLQELVNIFDERYRLKLPIFLTSNFPVKPAKLAAGGKPEPSLLDRVDRRAYERIEETFAVLEVTGPSFRAKGGQY